MIGGQKQEAAANALAVQVGTGNVIINPEMGLAQMAQLVREMRIIVTDLTAEALGTAERRIEQLEEKMAAKFIQSGEADPKAFADPDMQVLYRRAQETAARDGNEVTSDLLVELLAGRSKRPQRDRIALILNEATEKVGKLTDEDVAILSLLFLFYQVGGGVTDAASVSTHYKMLASPFIKEIRTETSAYAYLESLGCITTTPLTGHDINSLIYNQYDLAFCELFDLQALITALGRETVSPALRNILVAKESSNFSVNPFNFSLAGTTTPNLGWRFAANNTKRLKEDLTGAGFSDDETTVVLEFLKERTTPQDQAIAQLIRDLPALKPLVDMWSQTGLRNSMLTSVGLVIGHASLTKTWSRFNPALSVWIK